VFGVDNLYLTGASVFPSAGFANPTLTIVALARRLGRHLDDLLR
jgi:choline dehydrogenase-like flavoprotein